MLRVVITGAGTVNPLAHSVAGTFAAFAAGRCGIGPLRIRDVERLSIGIGAAVQDWQSPHPSLDRSVQFALEAARQAVDAAGLEFSGALGLGAGVILGTAGGGLATVDDNYRTVYAEGKNRVHPMVVPRLMHSAAASHVSMAHGLRGPSFCVSSACASSNHAIGLAFQMVRAGTAPVMLAGGAEAMLTFGGLKAWEGLRVMAPDACRPFSADRNGMVQGEGAAVFVLEESEHARARGAEILAEVAGFGMSADAQDLVAPSQAGAERAMLLAMKDGAISAQELGYINAHGTGTALNDRTEAAALQAVFGNDLAGIPVSSTKSMHGHLIGAAGAVELLACLLALGDDIIAPTVGYRTADPACALDVVPNTARKLPKGTVRATLSNAFAFGGLNAVLALRRR